ncbi:hypothetical protein [Streptomyces niveiscabiei]|uniref:Uncharacterized protein n=1 Tax=Streptomyces niveiscabiei TaxID=164115 RepID=A0ABW9I870_9ACTN
MIMSEAYDIRIGRRVRHVDDPSRAGATVRSFYAYPLVTVEWEATGQESTENRAYLTPVFTNITVREITDTRGRALRVTAYVEDDRRGERVVFEDELYPDVAALL